MRTKKIHTSGCLFAYYRLAMSYLEAWIVEGERAGAGAAEAEASAAPGPIALCSCSLTFS